MALYLSSNLLWFLGIRRECILCYQPWSSWKFTTVHLCQRILDETFYIQERFRLSIKKRWRWEGDCLFIVFTLRKGLRPRNTGQFSVQNIPWVDCKFSAAGVSMDRHFCRWYTGYRLDHRCGKVHLFWWTEMSFQSMDYNTDPFNVKQ